MKVMPLQPSESALHNLDICVTTSFYELQIVDLYSAIWNSKVIHDTRNTQFKKLELFEQRCFEFLIEVIVLGC